MRSTLTLKTLRLCALVAGVMAISASAAQAEAGAVWMEGGTNITGVKSSAGFLEGSLENSIGRLLTTINKLSIEVTCTSSLILGNVTLVSEGRTTTGIVRFDGCDVYKTSPKLEALGECDVRTPGHFSGTIETLPLTALLELHTGGKAVTLIVPFKGTFAHLEFLEEEKFACGVLPEKVLIGGTFVVEDCEGKAGVEQLTHLFVDEKKLSHLWAVSDTEEHHVTLDGSANVSLSSLQDWSGLPG